MLLVFISFYISPSPDTAAGEEDKDFLHAYEEYQERLKGITTRADITANGFEIIEEQVFPVTLENYGDVSFIPALDRRYGRLALFLAKEDGRILYKTDQLETNNRIRGELKQPNHGIAAVSFQDINEDGLTDIVLITSCINENGAYAGHPYKVGDILFQGRRGFYRDYRLSDRINRYSMNKSIRFITSFAKEGASTEFLYTATTEDELAEHGFQMIQEQAYWRDFEKLGKLLVAPGTYRMAEYTVFMVYLINEQGYIVWSFQPMEEYENLYALKGITCRDIDGDGLKDIVILGRYSYEDTKGESVVTSDYSIYYQRTSGFYEENSEEDFKSKYRCGDNDTMEELVEKARAYWGWKVVK